ncbi:SHOCT domain-containing protein [Tropicimonas sp. IMCC34043]|uniref:SHOCT domain-containing protein n=1 Tax=Tropicimonas sp. IMCC34043 TaxID=2248760 RepID=UPI0013007523|nr:SHOCT domain-containing protein [Tropicimonas sp. IMCC34043]
MPLFHILWSIFLVFLLVAWIWVLISVIADIFASDDISGWGKALWLLGVMILPWLGVLMYILLRGDEMRARQRATHEAVENERKAYIRHVAGSHSTADELTKLAELREKGVITEAEFAAQKSKLLG